MSSKLYVGDATEVHESWKMPWYVGCPDCYLCSTLLVSADEFPLDTTPYARAVISTVLDLKFPEEHDCENFK